MLGATLAATPFFAEFEASSSDMQPSSGIVVQYVIVIAVEHSRTGRPMKTSMTESDWLSDFEDWSRGTCNSTATLAIYKALRDAGVFEVAYSRTKFQSRAHFLIPWKQPCFELVRATIHTHDRHYEAWISKNRWAEWPADWTAEFEQLTGFEPCMGEKTITWCLSKEGNTEKLIAWLQSKAERPSTA